MLSPASHEHGHRVPFSIPPERLRSGITLFDGRTTTRVPFAQLREDVLRARERLRGLGLEPGACVGLLGENCYAWVVYDLAVLSLECIVVAFPEAMGTTSAEALADAHELSLLLVTRGAKREPELAWVIAIDEDAAPGARVRAPGEERGLRRRLRGTDACTVIFSSGTSGQLKALLLSGAGVDVTIDVLARDWQLGPDDGILVALPLSIFQQRLMVYAALRSDTEILLTDSRNLFRSFKALRPTFVLGPPALFETLENRFHAGPADLRAAVREAFGGRVRALLTGSAPSKPSTLALFEAAELPLYQAYGLAEVGFIAWNRPGQDRALSVGRPITPGSVSIADDGEIILRVPHPQALGYFGVDPAEEAQTFLPDGRIATGDLGYIDDDGYLFLTGRKKNLILLQSGEKIHPESLERELATPVGVERVVVIGGGELPWLVAIVAIEPDTSEAEEARIRAELQAAIDALHQRVEGAPRIERFLVTRTAFRPETGLVTRNLKLDRRAIQRHFEPELLGEDAGAAGGPPA